MTFGSKLEVVAAHRVGHLVLVTGDLDVPDPVSPQSFDLGKTVSGLAHPAGRQLSFATLSPSDLFSAGFGTFGVLAVVAVLGFVGFEQEPVLAEEARHPRRTIPAATYLALGVIAVVYAGAAWAMAAHAGQHHVVADAGGPGTGPAVRAWRRRVVPGRPVAVPHLAVRRRAGVPQLAVITFFGRDPRGETAWRRMTAPALAGVLLVGIVVLAVVHYDTLLGVRPGSPAVWLLPGSYAVMAVMGLV